MENNTSTNNAPQMQNNSITPPPVTNNSVAPPSIPDTEKPKKSLTASVVASGIFLILALIEKFLIIDGLASCNQKHRSISSSGPCTGPAFQAFFALPLAVAFLIFIIITSSIAIKEAKKAGLSGIHKTALVTIFASIAIAIFLLISFIIAVQ